MHLYQRAILPPQPEFSHRFEEPDERLQKSRSVLNKLQTRIRLVIVGSNLD